MPNNTYTCECGKSFTTSLSLSRHKVWHDPEYVNRVRTTTHINKIEDYNTNQKQCKNCSEVIVYEKRKSTFCCKSCAAIFNNKSKPKRSRSVGSCKNCNKSIPSSSTFCDKSCNLQYRKKMSNDIVESGNATAGRAKAYLIDLHGEKCLDPNCAWDFEKRPIKVEIEHINGNSEDNSLSNLTLLCPNCHSTTETYKNKNKGNGRYKRRQRYNSGKSA